MEQKSELCNQRVRAGAGGLKPDCTDDVVKQPCADLCVGSGTRKPFSLAVYHMKIQSAAVAPVNVHLAGM